MALTWREEELLAGVMEDPANSLYGGDGDGTMFPIAGRPEDVRIQPAMRSTVASLMPKLGGFALITGRPARIARRILGLPAEVHGTHGAELLPAGSDEVHVNGRFFAYADRVHGFVEAWREAIQRRPGMNIEDRGPIIGIHWRRSDDKCAAQLLANSIAEAAGAAGLRHEFGRFVLDIRPPAAVDVTKANAVLDFVATRYFAHGACHVIVAGDDRSDVNLFKGADLAHEHGWLLAEPVKLVVDSPECPEELRERATLRLDGVDDFRRLLAGLSEAIDARRS